MTKLSLTCADIDRDELQRQYLADALGGEEVEAFEMHYFACESCWASLQRAIELRHAFDERQLSAVLRIADSRGTALSARASTRTTEAAIALRRATAWWPLALVAAAALVITTSWSARANHSAISRPPIATPESDAMRGDIAVLPLRASASADILTVSWPRIRGADDYLVRLFGTDGMLLLRRETEDTSTAVVVSSLGRAAVQARYLWDVQARDRLRRVISRSTLTASPVSTAR